MVDKFGAPTVIKTLFSWSFLEKCEPYRDKILMKRIKPDIYAVRFALLTGFNFKK
jgi:hypothetical protein